MKKTLLALFVLVASASAADAQILTAGATVVNGAGPIKNLKVDGTISIQAGQTLVEVKITRGTIAMGAFTPNAPLNAVTLHPTLVNNAGTYVHQFLDALPLGTFSVKVEAKVTKPNLFGIPVAVNPAPLAYASATN